MGNAQTPSFPSRRSALGAVEPVSARIDAMTEPMTDHAPDYATHNGPAVEARPCDCGADDEDDPMKKALQLISAEGDRKNTVLRTARALIASHRANDLECYTIGGDPETMDTAERAAIAEYDVVLAAIDEVLK
jgi:hypothetical protein